MCLPTLRALAGSFAALLRLCCRTAASSSSRVASGIGAGAHIFPRGGSWPREDDVVQQSLKTSAPRAPAWRAKEARNAHAGAASTASAVAIAVRSRRGAASLCATCRAAIVSSPSVALLPSALQWPSSVWLEHEHWTAVRSIPRPRAWNRLVSAVTTAGVSGDRGHAAEA